MKIFFIHASAGFGHQKMAEAILESVKLSGKYFDQELKIVDILDYTPRQIVEANRMIEAIEDIEVENMKLRKKAGDELNKLLNRV